MSAERCKDVNWTIEAGFNGRHCFEGAQLAVLQDIRDEMKRLNELLHCQNFIDIPRLLREIRRNTSRKGKAAKR